MQNVLKAVKCKKLKQLNMIIFHQNCNYICARPVRGPPSYALNAFLDTSQLPDSLQHTEVIPILKKGDPLSRNNYRPIITHKYLLI